ncbi:MAG: c-type cytochrome domain-containing protein [Gemmataceae bacterium]|nr:hypothetical protein [Gemmata sp.]MDW8198554.1 c-type cytochrome domain-containing protein [Gemmataceae bacterium]
MRSPGILLTIALVAFVPTTTPADEPKPAGLITFEAHVQPILAKRCGKCHSGDRPRGELDLSSFANLMQGGISGKVVISGKPEESLLYTLTAHLEDPKMPPNSPKIPQTEIDTLRQWIAAGLVEKSRTPVAVPTPTPKTLDGLQKAATLPRATPITALATSPSQPLVAVAGNKQVLLYELPSAKLSGAVAFPEGEVHSLRFSRDGQVLVAAGGVGGQSGAVAGIDVGTGKRLFTITDTTDAILAADLSPDKTRVAFGGPGRVVKIVAIADGQVMHTFRKPTDWVLSVAFSPEGLLVAAGDRFGGLFVWEAKSGKEFATLRGHSKAVTAIAWQADSNGLASASEDGTVRLWDMHQLRETQRWNAHADGVLDVVLHADGTLATAGRDNWVRVWNKPGQPLAELGPASDIVMRVALSADGKTVVAGDWSGTVQFWPTRGGQGRRLELPIARQLTAAAPIPVPLPQWPTTAQQPTPPLAPPARVETLKNDLARKLATLRSIEEAVEKLKEEAARNPKNEALTKAYLQLCEAALAMKADVLETQKTLEAASKESK